MPCRNAKSNAAKKWEAVRRGLHTIIPEDPIDPTYIETSFQLELPDVPSVASLGPETSPPVGYEKIDNDLHEKKQVTDQESSLLRQSEILTIIK